MALTSVHPMLANKTPCEDVPQDIEWLVSYKHDGIRMLSTTQGPRSRSGKKFKNVHLMELLSTLPAGLDGEIMHKSVFTKFHHTQSAVNSEDGPRDEWVLVIYDSFWFGADRHAERRYWDAHHAVAGWRQGTSPAVKAALQVIMVPHQKVSTADLPDLLLQAEENGYEGICGRPKDAPYLFGKPSSSAWNLVAWKRFIDFEGVIEDVEELMVNGNPQEANEHGYAKRSSHGANKYGADMMGRLVCRAVNGEFEGATFKSGSGFSESLRKKIWREKDDWLGRVCTFKYQPFGSKDKPRSPIFRHERLPE